MTDAGARGDPICPFETPNSIRIERLLAQSRAQQVSRIGRLGKDDRCVAKALANDGIYLDRRVRKVPQSLQEPALKGQAVP